MDRPKGGEWQQFISDWQAAKSKKSFATKYGVSIKSIQNWVSEHKDDKVNYVPYHKFEIIKAPLDLKRTEEDMVVVITDWHSGKKTESYDSEIERERAHYLIERILLIATLHQPIRRIHLLLLGDMVQGENPYQGSKIGEVECGAFEQIHDVAVPLVSLLCESCLQVCNDVYAWGVPGNHGRYDKAMPVRTNWDNFFYEALKNALIEQPKIHVTYSKTFYLLINILGYRFFIVHGDQVNATQGIPLFAMRRKMQEWFAYLGGFNYAYAGHFHSEASDQVNSVADYTICPPLVTGDSWALEKVGRASAPVQLCFGVHEKRGRSWEYRLTTDEKYLPQRYTEHEGVIKIKG